MRKMAGLILFLLSLGMLTFTQNCGRRRISSSLEGNSLRSSPTLCGEGQPSNLRIEGPTELISDTNYSFQILFDCSERPLENPTSYEFQIYNDFSVADPPTHQIDRPEFAYQPSPLSSGLGMFISFLSARLRYSDGTTSPPYVKLVQTNYIFEYVLAGGQNLTLNQEFDVVVRLRALRPMPAPTQMRISPRAGFLYLSTEPLNTQAFCTQGALLYTPSGAESADPIELCRYRFRAINLTAQPQTVLIDPIGPAVTVVTSPL